MKLMVKQYKFRKYILRDVATQIRFWLNHVIKEKSASSYINSWIKGNPNFYLSVCLSSSFLGLFIFCVCLFVSLFGSVYLFSVFFWWSVYLLTVSICPIVCLSLFLSLLFALWYCFMNNLYLCHTFVVSTYLPIVL